MKLQLAKHQQTLQTIDNNSHLTTNLYELALLLAEEQSQNSQDRWACFIDNLSQICDEFATSRQQTDTQIPKTCSETKILSQLSADSDKTTIFRSNARTLSADGQIKGPTNW